MKLPAAGGVHDEEEVEAVIEVLRTSDLALGPAVAAMEAGVAELLAKRHGVMVNSGSSALRLAIDLLDLEPGDEVITSPLTFSTDIAPMVQSGIVPVFVDVDPDSYQIDVDGHRRAWSALAPRRSWCRTCAATCPTGTPSGRSPTSTASPSSRTPATSSTRGSATRRTGTRSDISVTSFARSHAMTAGGNGGMVGVDDEEQLDRCLSLRRWGRRSESYLFGSRQGTARAVRSARRRHALRHGLRVRHASATTSSRRSSAPPTDWCSCGSSTGSTASARRTGSDSRTSSPPATG